DRREQIVQIVRHSARHPAEQLEFLLLLHLVLEPDLVENQTQCFYQRDHQSDVGCRVRIAADFRADQQQPERLIIGEKWKTKLCTKTRQRLSRRVLQIRTVMGAETKVFRIRIFKQTKDR